MLRFCALGVALLTSAAGAGADDTIRLGGTFLNDDETQLVHRRGWGGGWGRGWGGWGGGYYGRSFSYGYARSYYGGYYRPYASFYRPYYSYYRPYAYYSSYYQPYYYTYPTYSYYFGPCSGDERTMPEATTLGATSSYAQAERAGPLVMPPADGNGSGNGNGNGTYRYDGGPRQPVPMPGATTAPVVAPPGVMPPRPTIPLEGKLVSLPPRTPLAYPAYGDAPTPAPTPDATIRLVSSSAPRPVFPAYGEPR